MIYCLKSINKVQLYSAITIITKTMKTLCCCFKIETTTILLERAYRKSYEENEFLYFYVQYFKSFRNISELFDQCVFDFLNTVICFICMDLHDMLTI